MVEWKCLSGLLLESSYISHCAVVQGLVDYIQQACWSVKLSSLCISCPDLNKICLFVLVEVVSARGWLTGTALPLPWCSLGALLVASLQLSRTASHAVFVKMKPLKSFRNSSCCFYTDLLKQEGDKHLHFLFACVNVHITWGTKIQHVERTVLENELRYCLLSWELESFCPESSYGYAVGCPKFLIFCVVACSGEGKEPVGQYPAWRGGAAAAAEVHADGQHPVGWAEERNGASHGAVWDPSAYAHAGP